MEEHSRSISQDLYNILGLNSFVKLCKSLVTKRQQGKNSPPKKASSQDEPKSTKEENKANGYNNYMHEKKSSVSVSVSESSREESPKRIFKHQNHENNYFTHSPHSSPPLSRSPSPLHSRKESHLHSRSISPSPLSRNKSKSIQNPSGNSLLKTMSRRNNNNGGNSTLTSSLSRAASRRGPIMYSNSNGVIKPPPIEETIECTLEELCFGCTKKIKITRDVVINDGQIIEEEETLTIKVKPGWRKGTKITFEGMGNETPGALPADIIFTVAEKKHHSYIREGDDLDLAVEIPLVEALTGCTLPIRLLGGEKMVIKIDDIIEPGYKKIIAGQGMPKPKEQQMRGNLVITFLVKFPIQLTQQQRSGVVSILQDSF